jgi:hypothetical protein
VQSIVLSVDGQALQNYHTPCNFTFAQPCPLSTGPQTLTLPTTILTDGPHTLTLVAIDAAGNESTIASKQIVVDNNPPPPPTDLSTVATEPDGSTFTVSWKDPLSQVAPITTATYQVCPANDITACSTPTEAPAEGPVTLTVPEPGSWILIVWLTNAAGNSSPQDKAADTTLTVPVSGADEDIPGNQGAGIEDSGGGSSSDQSQGNGGSVNRPPPTRSVRLSGVLNGRKLIVHVNGPAKGTVRVGYTAHSHDMKIASAMKIVTLKHGHLVVTFKLSRRAAAHATIRLSAQLIHGKLTEITLRA